METIKTCKEKGCDRIAVARDLCKMHYQIKRRSGELDVLVYPKECIVDGCNRKPIAKGYCDKHRGQLSFNGEIMNRTRFDPNVFIIKDDILEILLYNNKHEHIATALTNANMYELVSKYKWSLTSQGYVRNKHALLHRLVLKCDDESLVVDHINHDTLDNRMENLRMCTHLQNTRNKKIQHNSKSGVSGVVWNKKLNKWIARISHDGERIYLGIFKNLDDAIKTRKEAEEKYYGEYAYNPKQDVTIKD